MLDRVGQCLLGDPEHGQLDVRRRAGAVRQLEAHLATGHALRPADQPVEGRPDTEIVEDRQAEVAADGAQSVGHAAGEFRALRIAGVVEATDQEGHVLERVVVDVRGDPRPFGLHRRDHEIALELGACREPHEWPDREPPGQDDGQDPQHDGHHEWPVAYLDHGQEGDGRGQAEDRELRRLEQPSRRGARLRVAAGEHGSRGEDARHDRHAGRRDPPQHVPLFGSMPLKTIPPSTAARAGQCEGARHRRETVVSGPGAGR